MVLSFNDDKCQDLCTLLAQDVAVANQDLGAAANDVVFLGVNVNPLHTAVSDVPTWTDQHGLGGAPTGVCNRDEPPRSLRRPTATTSR